MDQNVNPVASSPAAAVPVAQGRHPALVPAILGLLAIGTAVPAWIMPLLNDGRSVATETATPPLGRAGVGPESVVGLRVVSWDDTISAPRSFEVKRVNNVWIIPSHHGYPADGNTRVTTTAAGILGVPRGREITSLAAQHESLGVVDPMQPPEGAKKGFGRRVTLTAADGSDVLDVIIGNRVETGTDLYYVREAGQPQVWTAKVESDLSTRFTDYVEKDPFKITREAVRSVAVVEYQVDPDKGLINPGPMTSANRGNDGKPWDSPQAPEGRRIMGAKVDEVLSELGAMSLQGVRPFDARWLASRGFYLGNQPQMFQVPNALTVQVQGKPYALFGTEGRLDVATSDGLRYSFMFGKIALGDDEDQEPEGKAPAKPDEAKPDEAKPADGANRYVAVFVTYDAALDEVAKAEAKQQAEQAEAAKAEGKEPPPPVKRKGLSGRERADKAQQRFQQFFYVISDASFKKLRPDVATWWEDKPAEPMAGATGKSVKQWLADNAALPGVTTTPSGLQYQVLASGPETGAKPTAASSVRVAYRGTLVDGEEFDANDSTTFQVTGVIKGWTEALQLMRPGDRWKLFVPPELGYGEAGSGDKIKANQILVFEVTLHEVLP
jgi:FKBP-type peptidyl-prolyl cis-trans isomerase